ncbi:hypothetical protein ACHAWC_008564 [Mediolabrus comicus]
MMMHFRGAISSNYRHYFLCKRSANLQRRSYHIGVSSTTGGSAETIDNESMLRNNTISRRLYRILLRSCKQGVDLSNKGNYIDNIAGSSNCLLLQPPMDPRKYGFAKIAKARRSNDDVGMAMEVLRFVHLLLGGDADDDLNHYYLGKDEHDNNNNGGSSSAGRHSEGHYTQFLDEDEERGEGSKDLSGTYGDSLDKDIGVDDDEEETADDTEELEVDQSILVTSDDLINAVRIAFRAPLISPTPSDEKTLSRQSIIQRRQRDAIDTAQILSAQLENWSDKSSVSVDLDHGVRVVATSSCLMTSSTIPPGQYTYKYAYRIRVENVVDLIDTKKQPLGDEPSDSAVENRAVQLLGRTWRISEVRPKNANHVSTLQRLLEDGALTKEGGGQQNDHEDEEETREVQVVNEPRTGAVGHLPVLGPGEVFEYMSGAELATPKGKMEGVFHMASVDMQTTDSAHVGNPVEALSWASNDKRRFEVKVGRFGFIAEPEMRR